MSPNDEWDEMIERIWESIPGSRVIPINEATAQKLLKQGVIYADYATNCYRMAPSRLHRPAEAGGVGAAQAVPGGGRPAVGDPVGAAGQLAGEADGAVPGQCPAYRKTTGGFRAFIERPAANVHVEE